MIDLQPAAQRTLGVVTSVADDQLGLPTPCPASSVGDLIDHVSSLSVAFRRAARKDAEGATAAPQPDAANLGADWRARVPREVAALGDAWRDPQAWEGFTAAGGIDMPGEIAGLVALNELVVHGWDIAVATGQAYAPGADEIEAAAAFVRSFDAPRDGALFGPIVPVADDAPPMEQLLGLTGRDPSWRPPA
jgi:uncharacterized protein (TIGR03086 family)